VVHAHGVRAGALSALALVGVATPLVVTLHNAVLARWPHRLLAALLERVAVRRADVVLGASTDLVDHARRLGARDARLGPVAAPALRVGRTRDEVRVALGLTGADRDRPLVVSIGRLAPQKDYVTLLDAGARLAGRADAPLLAVAGDGPLRAPLAGRIAAEALPVTLLGHREDVADLLAAADVFVLSSSWEARPLAVQEAMRAGVPVVATAVGGIPDLVGAGASLVPPGDGTRLADAIATLLDDAAARATLLRAAAKQVTAWPDSDDTVTQVLGVYEELTARR
jgi:glycosyltransferase involved in cell wall biosynthesis